MPAPAPRTPICVYMIFCDGIVQDPVDEKQTFAGVMNGLSVSAVPPPPYPTLTVVMLLTNLDGKYEMVLTAQHKPTNFLVHQTTPGKEFLTCDDPSSVLGMVVTLKQVKFPHAGPYLFTLTANGQVISRRPFFVRVRNRSGPPKPPQPPRTPGP